MASQNLKSLANQSVQVSTDSQNSHDFSKPLTSNNILIINDNYADNRMIYDWSRIKNPESFFLEQQHNYCWAEYYLETCLKKPESASKNYYLEAKQPELESGYKSHSKTPLKKPRGATPEYGSISKVSYSDHDYRVLERLLKHSYNNLKALKTNLKKKDSSLNFSELSQTQVVEGFSRMNLDPNATGQNITKQKQIATFQMLIAGAVLLRRNFEKIGIDYELPTQTRLNQHITNLYRNLAHLREEFPFESFI